MLINSIFLKYFFIKVKVGFTVKATANLGGSAVDLSKKNKGSISSLTKVKFPPNFIFKIRRLHLSRFPAASAVL